MTETVDRPNRRTIIGGIAALAVGLALGRPTTADASTTPRTLSRATLALTRATFTSLIDARVTVSGHGARVEAVVESVDDLVGAPAGHPAAYSLTLRPESETPLAQETYTVQHDGRDIDLFLVPVGIHTHRRYQAIINQLRYTTSGDLT